MIRYLVPVIALIFAGPALALSSSVTIDLGPGDAERRTVNYDCGMDQPLTVEYINAAPNFLALLPIEGQSLMFVAVLSASGARYAASRYVWWNDGPDASLYDQTLGEDAAAVLTCMEINNIP
jgi:membrane-bound inhibitor of C-type lysozyme